MKNLPFLEDNRVRTRKMNKKKKTFSNKRGAHKKGHTSGRGPGNGRQLRK